MGDLDHAATYLSIFKNADPKNADQAYLSAQYYIKKQNPQQAVASLKEAASMGYSDLSQLLGEAAFNSLHEGVGFKEVVVIVRKNAMK